MRNTAAAGGAALGGEISGTALKRKAAQERPRAESSGALATPFVIVCLFF